MRFAAGLVAEMFVDWTGRKTRSARTGWRWAVSGDCSSRRRGDSGLPVRFDPPHCSVHSRFRCWDFWGKARSRGRCFAGPWRGVGWVGADWDCRRRRRRWRWSRRIGRPGGAFPCFHFDFPWERDRRVCCCDCLGWMVGPVRRYYHCQGDWLPVAGMGTAVVAAGIEVRRKRMDRCWGRPWRQNARVLGIAGRKWSWKSIWCACRRNFLINLCKNILRYGRLLELGFSLRSLQW